MAQSNVDQLLPSKELATATALAQGYSDYKKRLEEKELAKQAQRSELLKIILPKFMQLQGERAQWERERGLNTAKFQLEQQKVAQTGQLGFAGLQVQMAGLENAWNIANMQELGETGRADARNKLSVQLKQIEASIQGMIETNKAGIAGSQIKGRADVSAGEIAGRADVAKIGAEASKGRVDALIANDQTIAKWNNDTKMAIATMAKEADKFPKGLSEQVDLYMAEANLAAAIWGMARNDPIWTEAANQASQNIMSKSQKLNAALEAQGGTALPVFPLPEVTTEKFGGFLGIGQKERTVPVVPSLTPARGGTAATGLEVQGQPAPMQLPALKTSGDAFQGFLNMMVEQGATSISDEQKQQLREMGIDPDALERAAQEAR